MVVSQSVPYFIFFSCHSLSSMPYLKYFNKILLYIYKTVKLKTKQCWSEDLILENRSKTDYLLEPNCGYKTFYLVSW